MPKQTKTIRGVISNVVAINTGTTDKGRKWILYEVKIADQNFRTFDSGYNEKIGKEGEWIYEEEDRVSAGGKEYKSKTLLPLSKAEKQSAPNVEQEKMVRGFGLIRGDIKKMKDSIEFRIGQLENLLQAISIKVSGSSVEVDKPKRPELKTFKTEEKDEIPIVEDEPKEEEIPF